MEGLGRHRVAGLLRQKGRLPAPSLFREGGHRVRKVR